MHSTNDFYLKKDDPNRSCLLALRQIILSYSIEMNETTKYGMPCFCFGKEIICYLWTDKKSLEPYILFVDGQLISHPVLEKGSRKRMQIMRICPKNDIPFTLINELLKKIIELKSDASNELS